MNNIPSASFSSVTPSIFTTENNTVINTTLSQQYSTKPAATTNTSDANIASNDYIDKLKKSQLILEKYPDRVPIIIQPSQSDRGQYPIDKSKYITPRELTLMQLQQIIRKRIKFPADRKSVV